MTAVAGNLRPVSPWTRLVMAETDQLGAVAAALVADYIRAEPHGVLGIATGASPVSLYRGLAAHRLAGLRTEGLSLCALDEYVGIAPDDPRSYRSYVLANVAEPLGIAPDKVHLPGEVADYDELITSLGGVGLQILGIGRNGHIGFNEPGSALDSVTRVVALDPGTRRANAGYFGGDPDAVPSRAMTQGIRTICSARQIVMVASGPQKAAALTAALTGPITGEVPASALQLHTAVTVVADAAAIGQVR